MSLIKYKRDKIISAVLDKGYSRFPEEHKFSFLWKRLLQEMKEITDDKYDDELTILEIIKTVEKCEQSNLWVSLEVEEEFWICAKKELGDLSNFIDFLYDRLCVLERFYKSQE